MKNVFFLLLLLSQSLFAQFPVTVTNTNSGGDMLIRSYDSYSGITTVATWDMQGYDSFSVSLFGNLTGTYVVQGSNDRQQWLNLEVTNPANTSTKTSDPFLTSETALNVYTAVRTTRYVRLVRTQIPAVVTPNKQILISLHGAGNRNKTISFFGDSMTAGSGGNGTNISSVVGSLFTDRITENYGIGGQTSPQIAARQGGLPIYISLDGNVNGYTWKTITSITPRFLSTPADTVTRIVSGTIRGVPCLIRRSLASDKYEIQTLGSAQYPTIVANTVFVPDTKSNTNKNLNVWWWGRNDTDLSTLLARYKNAEKTLAAPKRLIVVGVINSAVEPSGSAAFEKIATFNASLKAAYPTQYIEATPPTTDELSNVAYSLTTLDKEDLSKGIWPRGLRADNIHLNATGYTIMAYRIASKIDELGW